jgi:hypothetical protein
MDLQRNKNDFEKIINFRTWNIQDIKSELDFITKDLGNLKMDIITLI